jgi:pilus assembly protein CpaB
MQGRNWLVAAIAIAVGLIAVILANAYFTGVEQRAESEADAQKMVQIVVATQPLQFGTKLIPQNIKLQTWPAASVPQGAFMTVPDALKDNRVALRPIVVGEPILASKVSGTDGRATLAALLPEGMRAVAIPVSAINGVAGFVIPGTMVDVLLTRKIEGPGADREDIRSDVFLQNVEVLAVDQVLQTKEGKPKVSRTATIAVTLYDAQRLAIGKSVGTLSLVLRKVEAAPGSTPDGGPPKSAVGTMASVVTKRDLGGPRLYMPRKSEAAPRPAAPSYAAAAPRPPRVSGSVTAPGGFGAGGSMTVFRGSEPTTYPVGR